ncbi:hypothetical protein [Halorhodospira neutriphila]|uniref:Uncharacterized protein n=1 Tax=Halorhodospira neutriphila TaxID=168379 RepID=A0ABS1E8Y7_9GAMM|nr:hypothetical protein [Halorhodospira neutriphila]MBK1726851.1 hypothetical protein [Halorhodospira neutriphila]
MGKIGLLLALAVFLAHLVAFAWLGLRRRAPYYAAPVLTFSLLSGSAAAQLAAPAATVAGDLPLYSALRLAAWPVAAVSIGWTLVRLWRRYTGSRPGRAG